MESSQELSSSQIMKAPNPAYHEFSPYSEGLTEVSVSDEVL